MPMQALVIIRLALVEMGQAFPTHRTFIVVHLLPCVDVERWIMWSSTVHQWFALRSTKRAHVLQSNGQVLTFRTT